MDILCGGKATIQASHPADLSKQIFLSFDQSHIIKNVRSQFLAKDIGKEKQITSSHAAKAPTTTAPGPPNGSSAHARKLLPNWQKTRGACWHFQEQMLLQNAHQLGGSAAASLCGNE
ncbi:hypothetical protein MTO96_036079 [Rhipicephalus appendiculatus]